jgi:hypothetical protein
VQHDLIPLLGSVEREKIAVERPARNVIRGGELFDQCERRSALVDDGEAGHARRIDAPDTAQHAGIG